jgi:hypothetical protein
MVSSGRERWWARAGGDNDPHSVLGVARGASSDEVQAAYRKQMKECHPDLAASQGHVDGGVSSETRARQINAAMEELTGARVAADGGGGATTTPWQQRMRPVSPAERHKMFCERQPGKVMSARNNLRLRAVIMLTLMSIATFKRLFPDPDSPYYKPPPAAEPRPEPHWKAQAAATAAAASAQQSRSAAIAAAAAENMQQEQWDRL